MDGQTFVARGTQTRARLAQVALVMRWRHPPRRLLRSRRTLSRRVAWLVDDMRSVPWGSTVRLLSAEGGLRVRRGQRVWRGAMSALRHIGRTLSRLLKRAAGRLTRPLRRRRLAWPLR